MRLPLLDLPDDEFYNNVPLDKQDYYGADGIVRVPVPSRIDSPLSSGLEVC